MIFFVGFSFFFSSSNIHHFLGSFSLFAHRRFSHRTTAVKLSEVRVVLATAGQVRTGSASILYHFYHYHLTSRFISSPQKDCMSTAATPAAPDAVAPAWDAQRAHLLLLRRRSAALLRAPVSGIVAAAEAPVDSPGGVTKAGDSISASANISTGTAASSHPNVAVSAELAPFLSNEHVAAIRRYEAAAAERLAASEALIERRLAERAQRIVDIIRSTVGPTRRHVGVRVVVDALATYLECEQVTSSGPRVTGAPVAMPVAGVDGARAVTQNADASARRRVAIERAVRALAGLLSTDIGFVFVPAALPPPPPAAGARKPAPKKGRAGAAARRAREEAEAEAAGAAAAAPAALAAPPLLRFDVDAAAGAEDKGAGALLQMARLDATTTAGNNAQDEFDGGVFDRLSGVVRRVSTESDE
jgi:hypothetical protein